MQQASLFLQLQWRDGHDAAKMQRWWDVLQLSEPASGSEWMLGILKRNGGNGFLKKNMSQISFRQCVTFCERGQLKGWQPNFQPTIAKSSISRIVHWFAAVTQHSWEHNHCILETTTPWPISLLPCMQQVFFFSCNEGMGMMQPKCRGGGTYCSSQSLLLAASGCLEF